MKTITLIALVLVAGMSACKKEEIKPCPVKTQTPSIKDKLIM